MPGGYTVTRSLVCFLLGLSVGFFLSAYLQSRALETQFESWPHTRVNDIARILGCPEGGFPGDLVRLPVFRLLECLDRQAHAPQWQTQESRNE